MSQNDQSITAATRKRRFSLKLADLGQQRWQELPGEAMGGWTEYSDNPDAPYQPGLLDQSFGKACDYGALFTYLFRRFGLPNLPSDPYKDIADYALTTPLKDMLLIVSPSVGEWPRLSLRLLVTTETWNRLEIEPWRHWVRSMIEWRNQQGPLPEWMGEWLDFWRTKPGVDKVAKGDESDWGLSLHDMHQAGLLLEGGHGAKGMPEEQRELIKQVVEFAKTLDQAFSAIKPNPRKATRSSDWRTWPDDDLLKPYYAAAAAALADLATPVRVRDVAINAYGRVTDPKLEARTKKEPEVAGWAFGRFVNTAPKAVINLLFEVEKRGRGNLEKGTRDLLEPKDAPATRKTCPTGQNPWSREAILSLRSIVEAMPEGAGATGRAHLASMLDRVEADPAMSHGKLCRWLGWIQCALTASGAVDLDAMKQHNLAAKRRATKKAAT